MLIRSTIGRGFVLVAFVLTAGAAVHAGDDRERCCKHREPKGDVKSLKATLDWRDGQWNLHVRYKLEIKKSHPGDVFDLVLTPTECGRSLADQDGREISLAVAVSGSGNCCDDDKIKFCNAVSMQLPDGSICDPYRVRVRAELVDRTRNRCMDDESTKVKVCSVPCQIVSVSVRHETHYGLCAPQPPAVVYVAPAPVICPPPIVHYQYARVYRPVYDCGPRFYRGRSFGYRSHVVWGRTGVRGW